jgi:hypothetical protein
LAAWLARHPEICFSSNKEQRFWAMEYHNGLQHHKQESFSHYTGETTTMEGKPLNFHIHFVTERMKDCFPNAKLILVVRNPIERAYSAWHSYVKMRPGREIRSFSEAIEDNLETYGPELFASEYEYMKQADPMGGCYQATYIEGGLYGRHLMRFIENFGRESILVLSFESLSNPLGIVLQCTKFLGLNDMDLNDFLHYKAGHHGITAQDIKRTIPGTYSLLKNIYTEDAYILTELTDFDYVGHWGLR